MWKQSMLLTISGAHLALALSGTGHSTRYWDCCKPSCSWSNKVTGAVTVTSPVKSCDKNDNVLASPDVTSGCQSGTSFACSNNSPWAVSDSLAYGFAATEITGAKEQDTCCACFKLNFTSGTAKGKTMIVQSTNTGGDLSNNQFDLMMPGGGVGIFDGCSVEFGTALPGAQYGGVTSRDECSKMPAKLVAGCQWRFDWFLNADNPDFEFTQVKCPAAITAVSGCTRSDDGNFPAA